MLSSAKIGEKAALLYQDADPANLNVRLKVHEIAKWINEGCREIVRLKPSALVANVAMLLAAGSKQSLVGASFKKTSDGTAAALTAVQLLEPVRNMGATGTTPGRAITVMERQKLDVLLPNWHAATAKAEISHLIFDAKDPKTFYNYPPATAAPAVYAEVAIARLPVNALLDTATVLASNDIDAGLDDLYESALVDYVLYRKYSEESEHPASAARAQTHGGAFAGALGVKLKNEFGLAPRPAQRQAQRQSGE